MRLAHGRGGGLACAEGLTPLGARILDPPRSYALLPLHPRGGGAAAGGGGGPTPAEALTTFGVTVDLTSIDIACNSPLVKSRINARIRRNPNTCKAVRRIHIFIEIGFVGHSFPTCGGGAAAGGGGGTTHADGLATIRDHGPSQQIITPNINRMFPLPTCGGGAAAGGGGGPTHAEALTTLGVTVRLTAIEITVNFRLVKS